MNKFQECLVSELDLFNELPVQSQILKSEQIIHHPINSLTNCSTLEFESNGSSNSYRDLSNIFLHLKVQIVKPDGSPIIQHKEGENEVDKTINQPGFVNNVLHSLFKNVSVLMGGTIVSNLDYYNMKAYIDTITNYSQEACISQFQAAGFYKDTSDQIDDSGILNTAHVTRKSFTDNGKVLSVCGRVNVDIFNCNRLLMNNVNMKIIFTLDHSGFFILESSDYKSGIKILEAELSIRHVTVNPSIMLIHHHSLQKGVLAKIPFRRSVIKTHTISSGITNTIIDNLFQGMLPRSMIITMFDNTAFTNHKKSPFNFHHFGLNYFAVFVNGQSIPFQPLTMNFEKDDYALAYTEFLKNLELYGKDSGLVIDYKDWKNGFFMLSLNFSSLNGVNCVDLKEDGSIKFELRFGNALKTAVTSLFYAEYDSELRIDKNYNCSTLL